MHQPRSPELLAKALHDFAPCSSPPSSFTPPTLDGWANVPGVEEDPTEGSPLSKLAQTLGHSVPLDLTLDSERWQIYDAALARRDLDERVLASLTSEPDEALRSAVVIRAIEYSHDEDRERWLAQLSDGKIRDFARRRLTETRLLNALDQAHGSSDLNGLREGSDWLQRRAAELCRSTPVLELLAEHGRTRRVRRKAATRLRRP